MTVSHHHHHHFEWWLTPVYACVFMGLVGWYLVKYTVLLYVWAWKAGVIAYRWASPRIAAAWRSWRSGTLKADTRRMLAGH